MTPASFDANVNVAAFVGPDWLGPLAIVVCGAEASTLKSHAAGSSSAMPSALIARTSSVWSPSARSFTVCGEAHATNAPRSSEHSKVEPGWSDENVKPAVRVVMSDSGPVSIVVSGRATMLQAYVAGDASALPVTSIARTLNSWSPSGRPEYWIAESHGAQSPSSSAHSNVVPDSDAVNVKFASGLPVTAGGPNVIVVSGAVRSSTVQTYSAGTGSTIGSGLCVWTRNVCVPSARPL